jgi:uncharacterized protein (DUF983 family)
MTTKTRQEAEDDMKAACATACVATFLVPIVYTLVILGAWNVGIEPFFETLGNISFWQAFGLALAVIIVRTLVAPARWNKQ